MLQIRNLFLFIVLFILISICTIAQPSYDDQEIIPANPSAAAITKFIDFPMDYYSGTENITIPLENIAIGDIGVDVSLSYNGGGIKVDQTSGDVGLGWNLNAGGIITRTIIDRPDERGYMQPNNNFVDVDDFDIDNASHYNSLNANNTDNEPDAFSFVAGNYSGKFYFTPEGEIITVPYQDVKISKTHYVNDIGLPEIMYNSLLSFVITTPDGLIYTYGTDITYLEWTEKTLMRNCQNISPVLNTNGYDGPVVTA